MEILNGVRVIDLTMWAFVPSAGGVLAHWGADVIKIEPPLIPDPVRSLMGGSVENAYDAHPMYRHYNRGKRAMTLDLKTGTGREILYKLVDTADVFLTSYLGDTRRKLGFDIDDIRARNPRIIYAKGTGQGPKGPEAERGGYDGATFWGRGTLASAAQHSAGVNWPPRMIGHGDGLSGLTLAGGILGALFHRERTGEVPPLVDVSLMGTAMWFMAPYINTAKEPGGGLMPNNPREQGVPQGNQYRTKDGRFIILTMLGGEQDWVDLCDHLGRPDLATDPRFATEADRAKNAAEAVAILDEIFAQRTFEEWKKHLVTTRGVWAPVQTVREIHDDPQTIANQFIRKVPYPNGKTIDLVVPPMLFNGDGGQPKRAPEFNEHTDDVLDELGMNAQDIAGLREQGVIA